MYTKVHISRSGQGCRTGAFLFGDLDLVFRELGHEAILRKQSILASTPISASSTNHTLMSNTEIFSYGNKDTPSNRSITAEKKLSNGNLGSQKNVLYVQRFMF